MTANTSLADARFREWMRGNLGRAAVHFGVTVTGEPVFGWLDRSIGAPADREDERYWLRVMSEGLGWADEDFWTGNLDANAFTDIAKPRVLDVFDWTDWRQQRAELMTRLPGQPCSSNEVLRTETDLPDQWWTELRRTIRSVAEMPTRRVHADQDRVTGRIRARFGDHVDPTVTRWETVHGDLHWANLMCPRFGLLDWEWWGNGPAGTDAATLFYYSLLVPGVAKRVHAVFADVLDTQAGHLAQLYVIARLLRRVDRGDCPELAEPLNRHANAILNA